MLKKALLICLLTIPLAMGASQLATPSSEKAEPPVNSLVDCTDSNCCPATYAGAPLSYCISIATYARCIYPTGTLFLPPCS